MTLKTVRYVGGLAVTVELPTGRVLDLVDQDTFEVLPGEYKLLVARTDFETVEPKEQTK